MTKIKKIIHDFIGHSRGLKEYYLPGHLSEKNICHEGSFNKIDVTTAKGMQELAQFLDGAIAEHAILDDINICKGEDPETKQMPNLQKRKKEYLKNVRNFFIFLSQNVLDTNELESFTAAFIDILDRSENHLLKRQQPQGCRLMFWKKEDDIFTNNQALITAKNVIRPQWRQEVDSITLSPLSRQSH